MVNRLRVADPLPWLLLIGGLLASLLILPLSLFQSESFSDARISSYNEWVCGESSSPSRSARKLLLGLSGNKVHKTKSAQDKECTRQRVHRTKKGIKFTVLMQSAGLALRMTLTWRCSRFRLTLTACKHSLNSLLTALPSAQLTVSCLQATQVTLPHQEPLTHITSQHLKAS